MEYAVKRYPTLTIIYLESDAYVRTQARAPAPHARTRLYSNLPGALAVQAPSVPALQELAAAAAVAGAQLPMDTNAVRERGAAAAFTLSCQWFPYVHALVAGRTGGSISRNDEAAAELLPLMGDHLTLFHSGAYLHGPGGVTWRGSGAAVPAQALATSVFLIFGGPRALPLLQAWWDATPSKGVADEDSCTAALNSLMAHSAETRQSTELLDYPTYNGPNGKYIRHMDNNRGADPVFGVLFKHDVADTLLKHADKTTLYFTELHDQMFHADVDV